MKLFKKKKVIQTANKKQGVIRSLVNQFIPMFNNDTQASNKSPILVNTSNYSPELDATGQDIEIDESTIMGIPAFKSATDLIVGTIGSLPIELFRQKVQQLIMVRLNVLLWI